MIQFFNKKLNLAKTDFEKQNPLRKAKLFVSASDSEAVQKLTKLL